MNPPLKTALMDIDHLMENRTGGITPKKLVIIKQIIVSKIEKMEAIGLPLPEYDCNTSEKHHLVDGNHTVTAYNDLGFKRILVRLL